uniref:Intersectin-1 (SH3 domain-containing protein 1A) n=1 Tax=Schistosoma japonicum TaxID=6182 RepID=C1L461_SCHJA|nr:Intersectin-1 (SH3 domain-containing protein 1A) [Schistosoma japonicum]
MTQQGHELATRRNKIDDSHSRVSQKMQAYKLKRKSTDLSIPTSNTGSVQKELYEAMFDFTARHPDELSFTTGTLIDVFANAPINVGPETYVRKKVDGKIDPFDPFGVHKIMTNTSAPGGVIMTTATTIGTTTASTTNIPLNTTTAKSTNSFTEPLDKPVKSESDTKLGDAITDNDNNEFYGKVQQDWDISMSTISLPENITPDQLLTLKIEDNVKIIKENYNKEWLFGEITDKSGSVIKGWFPANCLKPFTKPSSLDFNFGLNMSSSPNYSSKQPNNILFSCIALYPYESNVPGDLNLSVGDLIRVYVIKDDWWEGVCERTQLKGLFPANYVRKLSIEENRSTEEKLLVGGLINDQVEQNNTNSPSQPKIIPVSSLKLIEANPDNNCTTSLLSSSNVSSSSSSGGVVVCTQPEFARVIAPYKATSTGQLTLQPGQVVQLRKRSPKGWWEGELQMSSESNSNLINSED